MSQTPASHYITINILLLSIISIIIIIFQAGTVVAETVGFGAACTPNSAMQINIKKIDQFDNIALMGKDWTIEAENSHHHQVEQTAANGPRPRALNKMQNIRKKRETVVVERYDDELKLRENWNPNFKRSLLRPLLYDDEVMADLGTSTLMPHVEMSSLYPDVISTGLTTIQKDDEVSIPSDDGSSSSPIPSFSSTFSQTTNTVGAGENIGRTGAVIISSQTSQSQPQGVTSEDLIYTTSSPFEETNSPSTGMTTSIPPSYSLSTRLSISTSGVNAGESSSSTSKEAVTTSPSFSQSSTKTPATTQISMSSSPITASDTLSPISTTSEMTLLSSSTKPHIMVLSSLSPPPTDLIITTTTPSQSIMGTTQVQMSTSLTLTEQHTSLSTSTSSIPDPTTLSNSSIPSDVDVIGMSSRITSSDNTSTISPLNTNDTDNSTVMEMTTTFSPNVKSSSESDSPWNIPGSVETLSPKSTTSSSHLTPTTNSDSDNNMSSASAQFTITTTTTTSSQSLITSTSPMEPESETSTTISVKSTTMDVGIVSTTQIPVIITTPLPTSDDSHAPSFNPSTSSPEQLLLCNETQWLECDSVNLTCKCRPGMSYDEERSSCVSEAGMECGESRLCIKNAACTPADIIGQMGICFCKEGFLRGWEKNDGNCWAGLGTSCSVMANNCYVGLKCVTGGNGSSSVCSCDEGYTTGKSGELRCFLNYNAKCDPHHNLSAVASSCNTFAFLNCSDTEKECKCEDPSNQIFDSGEKTCVAISGAKCTHKDDNTDDDGRRLKCVKNAECMIKQDNNRTGKGMATCECMDGYENDWKGNCGSGERPRNVINDVLVFITTITALLFRSD